MALQDNLISFWPFNSGGDAIDLTGGNTLTSVNSVGTGVGLTYPISRDFESGSTQYLTINDNLSLSVSGDEDFEFTTWVNFESSADGFPMILTKDDVSATREYGLYYNQGITCFIWETFESAGGTTAYYGTGVTTGTWYFLNCGRQASTNTSFITVDNFSSGYVTNTGVLNGTAAFQIGSRSVANHPFDGRIGTTTFHKRTLTRPERLRIRNAGLGITFEQLPLILDIDCQSVASSFNHNDASPADNNGLTNSLTAADLTSTGPGNLLPNSYDVTAFPNDADSIVISPISIGISDQSCIQFFAKRSDKSQQDYVLGHDSSSAYISFDISTDVLAVVDVLGNIYTANTTINTTNWHHYAINFYIDGHIDLYVDNSYISTFSDTPRLDAAIFNQFGYSSWIGQGFRGKIAGIKIYDITRTQTQIALDAAIGGMPASVIDGYFTRSFFPKNFFAGNYWPTPGEQVYDAPAATGGGGSSFNKDYSFGLLQSLLSNEQAQINSRFDINEYYTTNKNILINDDYVSNLNYTDDLSAQLNRVFNNSVNIDDNNIGLSNRNFSINYNLLTNNLASINTLLNLRIDSSQNISASLNTSYGITVNNLINNLANINTNLSIQNIISTNDSVLTSPSFNISYNNLTNNIALINDLFTTNVGLIDNANITIEKALQLNLFGNETVLAQINTNLGTAISLINNNNALSSKDVGFVVNTINNLNAQLVDGFGLANIGGSNLNALLNDNFPIRIGLLYDLVASSITLKDFTFLCNLAMTTNLIANKTSNFATNISLSNNLNALIGSNLNTSILSTDNIQAQLDKLLTLNLGLSVNNSNLKNTNFGFGINNTNNLIGLINDAYGINTNISTNASVIADRIFATNVSMFKNSTGLINDDWSTNLSSLTNLNSLLIKDLNINIPFGKNINAQTVNNFGFNVGAIYDLLSIGVLLKDFTFLLNLSMLASTLANKNSDFSTSLGLFKNNIGLLGTNLNLTINNNDNLIGLTNKNLILSVGLIDNNLSQINPSFGLNNILIKNLIAQTSPNFGFNIGLLYDLFGSGVFLKDFNFILAISLLESMNLLTSSTFGVTANIVKNMIGLENLNLVNNIGLSNNKIGLTQNGFNIGESFAPNNVAQIGSNLSVNTNYTDNTSVSLNRNLGINLDLLKNLLVSKNANFGCNLDTYLNKACLTRADLPVRIAMDRDEAKQLLKAYSFPLVVDLTYDIDSSAPPTIVIIDIEGIDDNFWCIIKEINNHMSTKDILTNISPENIQNFTTSKETKSWAISHEIIKITKGK